MKVVIIESAEHDLKALKDYIVKNHSRDAWTHTLSKIRETVSNIGAFPMSGSIPEELKKLDLAQYRQAISGLSRIIYEVRRDVIYIHIVADSRRDMKSLLMRRFLRGS